MVASNDEDRENKFYLILADKPYPTHKWSVSHGTSKATNHELLYSIPSDVVVIIIRWSFVREQILDVICISQGTVSSAVGFTLSS